MPWYGHMHIQSKVNYSLQPHLHYQTDHCVEVFFLAQLTELCLDVLTNVFNKKSVYEGYRLKMDQVETQYVGSHKGLGIKITALKQKDKWGTPYSKVSLALEGFCSNKHCYRVVNRGGSLLQGRVL